MASQPRRDDSEDDRLVDWTWNLKALRLSGAWGPEPAVLARVEWCQSIVKITRMYDFQARSGDFQVIGLVRKAPETPISFYLFVFSLQRYFQ